MELKKGDKIRVKELTGTDRAIGLEIGAEGVLTEDEEYLTNVYVPALGNQIPLYRYQMEKFEQEEEEVDTRTHFINLAIGVNYMEIKIVKVIYRNPATIVFIENRQGKVTKSIAKCHPNDTYSKAVGHDVAVLKYMQKEIPKLIEEVTKNV